MAVNFRNIHEIKELRDWLLHLPVFIIYALVIFGPPEWIAGRIWDHFLSDSVYCVFLCCPAAHQSVGKLGRWPPDLPEEVAKYQEVS